MNWLTKSVLPKIKAFVNKDEVKENLWVKCSSCEQMIFSKDLYENLNICTTCNFHMPFYPKDRLKFLFDDNSLELIDYSSENQDILNFKDIKKYSDRLKQSKLVTEQDDCIYLAKGKIKNFPVVVASFCLLLREPPTLFVSASLVFLFLAITCAAFDAAASNAPTIGAAMSIS